MPESKIKLRASILQEIADLRALPAVGDADIQRSIDKLSSIEDKELLCSVILKEINGTLEYFDGVLAILALHLTKNVLEKTVFSFLEKQNTTEEKKLFLLNLLNQAGFKIDPNLIHVYVKDADKLVDVQTEKFLQMAEVNPEAQIDFLDFYFGVNAHDRYVLLDSIIRDFKGDTLANILTPLVYSCADFDTLKMCIEGFYKAKSYLAFKPLEWLIETSKDKMVLSLARKTKNELKMAGLRKNISLFEYYTELFKTSKPKDAFVSSLDGMSYFSVVFSRIYNNGTISAFFAVFNLDYAPISCFGISNITEKEYKTILSRFFRDTENIPVEPSFVKSLMEEITLVGQNLNIKPPYELLCWRQLTYDILNLDTSVEEYMKSKLVKKRITHMNFKQAIDSDFGSKWFFTYSKRFPGYIRLIDRICALPEKDFSKFEEFTSEFIKSTDSKTMYDSIKKRLLYQSFFLYCAGYKNVSSLFYSIYSDDSFVHLFFVYSIRKSVYQFFINLQNLKDTTDMTNIFAKQRRIKYFDFNAKLMLELIEKRWTS